MYSSWTYSLIYTVAAPQIQVQSEKSIDYKKILSIKLPKK